VRNDRKFVLDSFALLAFLDDKEGAEEVEELLSSASRRLTILWLSIVQFGEVLYITERERGIYATHLVVATLDQLPLSVVMADRTQTFVAAHIKARFSLSYADAFTVALALDHDARVVTGDPEFEAVEDLVGVHWLGR
jgi:ribonuclease VapC